MATTPTTGMEAQHDLTEQQPNESITQILSQHSEALVIVTNPAEDHEGESKIAVFTKLLDENGVLAPVLEGILRNLLATSDGKQCSGVSGTTAVGA